MRKQRARRLTTLHCGRLILQLCVEPRLLDTQHDKVVLPAIKPVGGIDQLGKRRAMDKSLRPQTTRRISPASESLGPITAIDDMSDHPEGFIATTTVLPSQQILRIELLQSY